MISLGGGIGLLVIALLAAYFAETRWVRVLCWVYVGMYMLGNVAAVIFGNAPAENLLLPSLLAAFALYLSGVHEMFKKW